MSVTDMVQLDKAEKRGKHKVTHGFVNDLHVAVLENDNTEVQLQHGEGANLNEVTGRGLTPLMLAAVEDKKDIIKTLLELNADMELTDPNGNTAIQIAVLTNHPSCCDLLIKAKASFIKQNDSGLTVL